MQSIEAPIDVLTASLAAMPLKAKVDLMHKAAAKQNLRWLQALQAGGAFKVPDPDPDFEDRRFHPWEAPLVAGLASVVKTARLVELVADPDTGEQMPPGTMICLTRCAVSAPMLAFFREAVLEFLQDATARIEEDERKDEGLNATTTRNCCLSTSAVLLSAACAINDHVSIRHILHAFPGASEEFIVPLSTAQEATAHALWRPLAFALSYGHREALDALLECGVDPLQVVARERPRDEIRHTPPGPRFVAAEDAWRTGPEFIASSLRSLDLFLAPSVLDKYLQVVRQASDRAAQGSQEDVYKAVCANTALSTLARAAAADQKLLLLLPILDRYGALDYHVDDMIQTVATYGHHWAWPFVEHRIDWSLWDSQTPEHLRCGMAEFPPIVMADNRGNKFAGYDGFESDVTRLCQRCIDAGYGHLLAITGDEAYAPVREFAAKGLAQPMLLCLEQGADPHCGRRCGPSAFELCEDEPAMENIMRAYLARMAARDAQRELLSAPGGQP